ncbi:ABC transporter substrate-binding protein [Rufibacter sp. H-1]|uniref:ABC transporter substrate-binding protein n=2 Tax=Rufibacter sediminis TaxID=2762756 RepID=A0ABR6VW16_9BACT|nr:helical backbone metal receptor [Rufibacter sediminis]MBC3541375.1 ABC transporter substrate-binding protein [Rufibacter sediminis]
MNRQVSLPQPPRRIVSLVPSQTELLFHLGLGDKIVGVTKFCIHPKEQVKAKTKIGGTKNFNFEVIDQLQPDLIIGNKEENYQAGIEQLQQKYPVWMSDIYSLDDSWEMMQAVGHLTDALLPAEALVSELKQQFAQLQPVVPAIPTAYFIWRNPYMGIGNQNFIDHLLTRCGFENVLGHLPRYPEVSAEQLRSANPRLILLSSEPYPFKEKHIAEFRAICPEAQIKVVDGELFSWYGSRLLHSVPYLQELQQAVMG